LQVNDEQEAEFSAFAVARWSALVRSATFLGCDATEAHDVAQEALVRCYRFWARVQRADDVDAYVFRILLNARRDMGRRKRWREVPTARLPEASVPDSTEAVGRTDAVRRSLDALTEGHRQVLVLRYFAHLSEKQVAHALDIPVGTVKSRLSRALDALANSPHLVENEDIHQREAER
jgi:RNA polymerase sigma-70 factor (sigma-E family)